MGAPHSTRVAAVAAGATSEITLWELPKDFEETALAAAHFVPDTAQAVEGATNFVMLTLRQWRAGAFLVNLGTINIGTQALVAETPQDFTLTNPDAQVRAGDVITLQYTQAGTGGATPAGVVEWELQ